MKCIGSKWQALLPLTQLLLTCSQALEHISVLCHCRWSFKTVLLWSSRSICVLRLETLLGLGAENKRNSRSNCDVFSYSWVLDLMGMNKWKGWDSSGCALFRSTEDFQVPTVLFLCVWTRVMLTLTQLQQHRQIRIWGCLLFALCLLCPTVVPGTSGSFSDTSIMMSWISEASNCWMPLWICNPCTWNPCEPVQSKLLQTKYMFRMCWKLAA